MSRSSSIYARARGEHLVAPRASGLDTSEEGNGFRWYETTMATSFGSPVM